MADQCPCLDYRDQANDSSFETARPYCTAADRFVQPMRADICNNRYELHHQTHCEIYREHAERAMGAGDGLDATDERSDAEDT